MNFPILIENRSNPSVRYRNYYYAQKTAGKVSAIFVCCQSQISIIRTEHPLANLMYFMLGFYIWNMIKTKKNYQNFIKPTHAMIDFEKATKKADEQRFPGIIVQRLFASDNIYLKILSNMDLKQHVLKMKNYKAGSCTQKK